MAKRKSKKKIEYLPQKFLVSEKHEIHSMAKMNSSFAENIIGQNRKDYTKVFMDEMDGIINAPFSKNFVINIMGGIGRQMGIFKSSLGLQLALKFYPDFDVEKQLALTYSDLNLLVKSNAKRDMLFILDEQVRDLKHSQIMMLCNTIESCREKGLSFILIGVPEVMRTVSDWQLSRLGESSDEYLPKKTVYYSLGKKIDNRKFYMGLFKWNITPLDNEKWKKLWEKYMKKKTIHQDKVIDGKVTGFPVAKYAKLILEKEGVSDKLITERGNIKKPVLKLVINEEFPDITNKERQFIYTYILEAFEESKITET